jgi:hypothetical protein
MMDWSPELLIVVVIIAIVSYVVSLLKGRENGRHT